MDYDDNLAIEPDLDEEKMPDLDDDELADDASVFDDMDDGGFAREEIEEEMI